jgi:hypothetical protein
MLTWCVLCAVRGICARRRNGGGESALPGRNLAWQPILRSCLQSGTVPSSWCLPAHSSLVCSILLQCCGPRIRDPVPSWPPDPGSRSRMNNPDHISESLETIFWVKILNFFDADPGWKKFESRMENIRIGDKHPGSSTLIGCCCFCWLVSRRPCVETSVRSCGLSSSYPCACCQGQMTSHLNRRLLIFLLNSFSILYRICY